jgi:Tol biopolymer transport system component
VAIKVLPASFSTDAERLRRFEQEARAAGVLNHPNITAVYDIGAVDGSPYVVQELLEGETLRSTLAGGKLSTRRATDYATQIAHGLAAAHDKGIVHRDLKPENLFVTKDGRLKILDFGLAKLTQTESAVSSATNLPTETKGTEPGVVLGTLGYMSPEQVRGRAADARSDIFSFGAILYEMLSGRRAFHGDSAADTMSAILKEDPPDLSVTNQSITPGLDRIVRHCIEKNPEQRFHSAHDVGFALEALSQTSAPQAAAPPAQAPLRLSPLVLGLAGLALGFALAFVLLRSGSGRSVPTGMPTYRRLTNLSGSEEFPALSPDGQLLAFVHRANGKANVFEQRAGSRKPSNLTADCDRESDAPAFSPDGSQIAYASQCGDGGLFVMTATGENVRRLTTFGSNPAWSPDGREVVFATEPIVRPYGRQGTSELWVVEVGSGKTRRVLTGLDGVQPNVSPHGLRIAYWALPTGGSQRDVWTIPFGGLKPGEQPVAVTNDPAIDWNPVWASDGRSLYFLSNRNGVMNLWRVPIDESTGKVLGPAEPLSLPAREVGGLAVAKDGRHIAFVDRRTTHAIERIAFDGDGRSPGKPDIVYEGSQEIADFDVSLDGKSVAFDSRGGAQDDLFVMSADGSAIRQLLDDAPRDRHPMFTADGKRLVFISDRTGRYEVWSIATDGSGLTQVTKTTEETLIEPLISPDGRRIAAHTSVSGVLFPVNDKGVAGPMEELRGPADGVLFFPLAWSADGRTLFGSGVILKDHVSKSLLVYDVETKKLSEPAPGLKTLGRASRGSSLGTRFVYRDADGIHVFDPAAKTDKLVLPHPPSGLYNSIACRNTSCYLVRGSNSADIWMRTEAEAKGP